MTEKILVDTRITLESRAALIFCAWLEGELDAIGSRKTPLKGMNLAETLSLHGSIRAFASELRDGAVLATLGDVRPDDDDRVPFEPDPGSVELGDRVET